MLKYTVEDVSSAVKVTLQGDLDIEGTEIMNDELLPKLLEHKVVQVSMEQVPFVDSSGMGLLINLVNTLKENDTTITITDVAPDVLEVFELLQLPDILGQEVFNQ
ncbi:STAS domain-containing protein [Ornithinibacillus contaminans]|uniref:STAS domain-containing protein n=1 Tax=Ornithinibacillus contaminans TaxID=694055 RepID=UPI00064DE903|nr:STAS domain-containing protein [Ornithinibacillus contaminans]